MMDHVAEPCMSPISDWGTNITWAQISRDQEVFRIITKGDSIWFVLLPTPNSPPLSVFKDASHETLLQKEVHPALALSFINKLSCTSNERSFTGIFPDSKEMRGVATGTRFLRDAHLQAQIQNVCSGISFPIST